MATVKTFLESGDILLILSAVQEAEARTSGKIRIRLEKEAGRDPLASARRAFQQIGLRKTKHKNGVLFFLGVDDRKLAVLGDDGIHAKVPPKFWGAVADAVIARFRQREFAKGLIEGIKMTGEQLTACFPQEKKADEELPDAISYGKDA